MPRLAVDGQTGDAADLSFRRRGLRLLADAPMFNRAFTTRRKRRILLVHGYAIGEKGAVTSMAALRRNLGRRSEDLGSQCLTMTWPGDRALVLGGPAAYPWLKGVAIDTGEALFRFLKAEYDDGRGSEELVIVAHSLGCRVTLEFLERLGRAGRPKRLKKIIVILMAAAVPTELDLLIRGSVAASDSMIVLHSPSDWVLKVWFRLGQTVAGEGKMPEAIGLNGLPEVPGWTHQRQMTAFGHSEYWSSDETAEVIAFALRCYAGVVLQNNLERIRALPLAPGLPSRELFALHELARVADITQVATLVSRSELE